MSTTTSTTEKTSTAPLAPAAPAPTGNDLVPKENARRWAVPIAPTGAGGAVIAPTGIHEVVEMAQLMAKAGPAVPKHCRGEPGVCLAIAMRALNWGMNPFALAEDTYIASKNQADGVVAYGAKSVNAAINTSRVLRERLNARIEGEGLDRVCIVVGTFRSGEVREYKSPKFKDITPKNSPLWTGDPDRQFIYWSTRAWARLWAPEIVLGVYTPDDFEDAIERAPQVAASPVVSRITANPASVFDDDDEDEGDAPDAKGDDEPADAEEGALDADSPIGERFAHACSKAGTEDDLKAAYMDFAGEIEQLFPADIDKMRGIYEVHQDRLLGRLNDREAATEVGIILEAMAVTG